MNDRLVRPRSAIYTLKRREELGAWGVRSAQAAHETHIPFPSRLPGLFYLRCSSEAEKCARIILAGRRSAPCRTERRRLL